MQHRDIIPLVATFLALLCRILNIPISWRKTELDVSIHWIGWSFHFSAGYIDIPKEKRDKLIHYIKQLVRHSRIPRTYLEKVIGLIMWITQLFPFMRIWVRHLYNDLYSIPCTNYSMDPGYWSQFPDCLTDQLQFKRQPASSAIPIGSTLVSIRHQDIASKSDLQNIRISHRRIWMRIRDPGTDKRILTKNSLRILALYQHWLEHSSPPVPLRPRPLWCGFAAADAFANADVCVALEALSELPHINVTGSLNGLSNTISLLFGFRLKMICKRLFQHWSFWHRLLSFLPWLAPFQATEFQ